MPRRQRATIQFTAIQLAALAGCVFGAVSVVFLFGIYVGRGMPAHHAGIDERVARIPVAEPPRVMAFARGPMAAVGSEGDDSAEMPALSIPPTAAEALAVGPGTAVPQPAPKPVPESEEEAAAVPSEAPAVPTVPYTVQVLATRNKTEAATLAAGLKKKRIGAFVSEVEDTAGSWYRVRIGIYDDLESAQVMETRLRNLGLQQAYVSRYR